MTVRWSCPSRVEIEVSIDSYSGVRIGSVPAAARYALYIVRSSSTPDLYRIGATGVGQGTRNDLAGRLRGHAGKRPMALANPPNWTEIHRPWAPVWVAHLPSSSRGPTLCCERYLQAQFALIVRFVDESGFQADDLTEDEIVEFAERQLPHLERVIALQTASFFVKEPKTGQRWRAPWADD